MSLNTTCRLQTMANNVDPSKFQVLIRKNPPIYLNILAERPMWLLWEPTTLSEDGLSGSFMFSGHWPLSGLGCLGQRWIMEISGDKLRPAQPGPEWDDGLEIGDDQEEWMARPFIGTRMTCLNVWWLVASQEFSRKRNTRLFFWNFGKGLLFQWKIVVNGAPHSHLLLSKSWLPGSQR